MDRHTKAQRSRNMQAIKASGTKIEQALGTALRKVGLCYRLNVRGIPGTPDFAFIGIKVAVFCDSEFWHGKNWTKWRHRIETNQKFWLDKIQANIKRDKSVNVALRKSGWKVIRFWGENILKKPDKCAMRVLAVVSDRKSSCFVKSKASNKNDK